MRHREIPKLYLAALLSFVLTAPVLAGLDKTGLSEEHIDSVREARNIAQRRYHQNNNSFNILSSSDTQKDKVKALTKLGFTKSCAQFFIAEKNGASDAQLDRDVWGRIRGYLDKALNPETPAAWADLYEGYSLAYMRYLPERQGVADMAERKKRTGFKGQVLGDQLDAPHLADLCRLLRPIVKDAIYIQLLPSDAIHMMKDEAYFKKLSDTLGDETVDFKDYTRDNPHIKLLIASQMAACQSFEVLSTTYFAMNKEILLSQSDMDVHFANNGLKFWQDNVPTLTGKLAEFVEIKKKANQWKHEDQAKKDEAIRAGRQQVPEGSELTLQATGKKDIEISTEADLKKRFPEDESAARLMAALSIDAEPDDTENEDWIKK